MSSETLSQALPQTLPGAGSRAEPDAGQGGRRAVITVRGLSKHYFIYPRPIDRLKQAVARPGRVYYQEFPALKPLDLEIYAGETVGLIGRNGSGKSTLLQLLVGTLTATTGTVETRGRVAALLELGTGFNPEFSGRDNVYLYAAMMGFSQQEIRDRLDGIVAFADIGHFIDHPVRTYSSGMYIRLAFSVAVSLEPDVLVVDEALAVGDEAFQRKCFHRIEQLQKRGATILFVSHSAASVVQLCSRAILLDQGELLLDGKPRDVVVQYHRLLYGPTDKAEATRQDIRAMKNAPPAPPPPERATGAAAEMPADETAGELAERGAEFRAYYSPEMRSKSVVSYGNGDAEIEDPHVETPEGERVNVLVHGDEYVYTFRIRFVRESFGVLFGMFLRMVNGFDLGGGRSALPEDCIPYVEAGRVAVMRFRFRCRVMTGTYFINCGVSGLIEGERQSLHRLMDAVMIQVQPSPECLSAGVVDFDVASDVSFPAPAAVPATP